MSMVFDFGLPDPLGIGGALSLIGDVAAPYALIMGGGSRSIGTIFPDIVVEEHHRDELIVTDHPVETGASVSDHAFKLPVMIEMRCGFSDSTAQTEGYVQEVYQELLALQAQREPFDVSTGKRDYTNMLIVSLETETNEKSENALNITVGMREVIIVSTDQSGSAPASEMTNPQQTAAVSNKGTVSFESTALANDQILLNSIQPGAGPGSGV